MKKYKKTLMFAVFLIFAYSLSVQATYIDVIDEGYIFDPIASSGDVADLLGLSETDLYMAKIENGDDPPGGGIGSVSAGGENDFWLTTTGTEYVSGDSEPWGGEWEAEVPILAFELKAGGYSLLTILDAPYKSGSWDLKPLYDWLNNDPLSSHYDSSTTSLDFTPSLSHFTAYDPPNPVPEPATMLLLGTGLIGLAGVGRGKFKK